MKALVTGFDPFGGDAINPSYEAVRRLPALVLARAGNLQVVSAELPTSFARAPRKLRALMVREQPDIVLCVGLAADRPVISVERVAINLSDARIADNDGAKPRDRPVVARAPAAYFSSLPVMKIVKGLDQAGISAESSTSAGTFVCNHVFYGLMHIAGTSKRKFLAGFVHVPGLPAGRNDHQAKLNEWVTGLIVVLEVTRRHFEKS